MPVNDLVRSPGFTEYVLGVLKLSVAMSPM
jgi:hypothetical protein